MCGICGIIRHDINQEVEKALLIHMRDSMTYRGPDDAGIYLDGNVGLGSRRLSIIDLSAAGHMPMSSPDGRYWIVYNGEVYNFAELRAELETKGVSFRSNTDTEVLINLYRLYGPAMLARCNGMFAIAIWDTQERRMFIARDRMGIKPFFYAIQDQVFFFGSEEKSLFAAGVRAVFDESTWLELLCFRYVSGSRTPYQGVSRLLPGHYMFVQDGKVEIHQWWNLEDASGSPPLIQTAQQATESLLELLDNSIRLRRISDVPVGVLLSGGLDSGAMAALMTQQAGQGVESFTVRFDQREYDEGALARQVAERWNLKHHELIVSPQHIPALLQEATHLLDEPVVHGNDLHILAISRYAKPLVTVLLSGEGADEVLGGYVRYRMFLYEALFNPLGYAARILYNILPASGRQGKILELLALRNPTERLVSSSAEVFPHSLNFSEDLEAPLAYRWQVARQAKRIYTQGVHQVMFYEQHTYLQSVLDRNDRMTMGASIECREPYLDYKLVEWAARIPQDLLFKNGVGKDVLRRAMRHHLPASILQHKKWGFGVPWHIYFRELPTLRGWIEKLPAHAVFESLPGGRGSVRAGVQRFLAGDNKMTALMRQWVMISLWHTQKIEGKPEPLASLTPSQRFMYPDS